MTGRFDGKVVLVTGAGGRRGIGRSTALRFARDGADVALLDIPLPVSERSRDEREDWRGTASVADEVQALGRHALALDADVSDEAQVESAVAAALDRFGRIDFLVANAAARPGADRAPVIELPAAELRRVLSVNLVGAFLCCKAVGRHLAASRRGAIVIVSSQAARTATPGMAAYAASKIGQLALAETLAQEMAPHGVRVNAVMPGLIDTARLDWAAQAGGGSDGAADVEAARARLMAQQAPRVPLGRAGTPEDVAGAIAFLCSDEAGHVTGQVLGIDGGSRSW